jgi:DNA polymerase-3 subunit alpha
MVLRVEASRFGAELIEELKGLFEAYPGRTEVTLEMRTTEGVRKLRFGDGYRVDPDHGLRAELDQLLGPAALAA